MSQPIFSIIVPIYKVEKFLPKCIDSLLSQNFNSFEIILVDDGSPDRCPQICDDYAANNPIIKVIHKDNGGLSDARNAGIEIANGEYITFTDSDDFWLGNDVLSGVYNLIKTNSWPDIIVSDFFKYYDSTNKYVKPAIIFPENINEGSKQEILEYLYFCQADLKIAAWQKFVKHELLSGNLFQKGLLHEDIDWSFKIYSKAKSVCVFSKPYYCYRQLRAGSITNSVATKSLTSFEYIIQTWKNQIPRLQISEKEKQIYLGYLAYQLSIAISLVPNFEKKIQTEYYKRFNEYLSLFDGNLNYKTKRVKTLIRFFGIKRTSQLLHSFINLRNKINSVF